MQPPCLLTKITASPRNVNTAQRLHIVFTKMHLSAEKRRQPLRRLISAPKRFQSVPYLPHQPGRELRPMAHASTKQIA